MLRAKYLLHINPKIYVDFGKSQICSRRSVWILQDLYKAEPWVVVVRRRCLN